MCSSSLLCNQEPSLPCGTMHHLVRCILLAFVILQSSAATLPSTPQSLPECSAPIIIHQFPPGTALENQHIRRCEGDILVTLLTAPEVYLVAPDKSHDPILVATFPGTQSVAGIVELQNNVFYVGTNNLSLSPPALTLFTSSIWKVDLTKPTASGAGKVTKVADIPNVGFADGITVLNNDRGIILLGDTWNGVVWSFNVNTGSINLAINDTTMAAPLTADAINGIQLYGNSLFYTNTFTNSFYRIGIDKNTGHATSPAVLLATQTDFQPDDFTLDTYGNAFVASHFGEVVYLPGASTASEPIAIQDIANFSGTAPTSVQFGVRSVDLLKKSFFVTSNGYTNGSIDLSKGAFLYQVDNC
ncbi:hypothetical protein ACMFMG_005731 [Clarireedia jacksonii]